MRLRRFNVLLFACAAIIGTVAYQRARAFGTVQIAGQHAEHEHITRRALGCDGSANRAACFEPRTLEALAGKSLSFGAVGSPDNPTVGLLTTAAAHCDAGDFFDLPGYPQSKAAAQQALTDCRAWMKKHLDVAVAAARGLVSNKGKTSSWQISLSPSCTFAGHIAGRAKCTVLENFGIVLHASQDFYSHTNWNDKPPLGQLSSDNPPGLGNEGPAPWLDLRTMPRTFPAGLISGCFESASILSEELGCNYGPDGKLHRVKHAVLNKDKGIIDDKIEPGTTPRGMQSANFERAVQAAIDDSRDKWATLRRGLINTYGTPRGTKMICTLTHDDPSTGCKK